MPDMKMTSVAKSKLSEVQLQNIPFGKVFTDHMLVADYANGEWSAAAIVPYGPLQVEPSSVAWHYGQAIFEGIKAYPTPDGGVAIFRPYDNFKRFNASALRMQMPEVPEESFMEGMLQLIAAERKWVPQFADHALYIRPFMFASEHAIGVRPSANYKFLIILSPTGPYFTEPMSIYVEEHYVRAVEGGVGAAKTAGNYAAAMMATAVAREKGFDQVLWMDAKEHKYVQECGVMNVFFVLDDVLITPSLEAGTILAGVTRDSVLTVANDMGLQTQERQISIDELVEAYHAGKLTEAFGSGTAATISYIRQLTYREVNMKFDTPTYAIAPEILQRLNAIRYGHAADKHQWMQEC